MKRKLEVLLTIFLVLAIVISPVAAANNQGLQWAVASGDRFDGTISSEFPEEDSVQESIYVLIDANPPTIPDDITIMSQIPEVSGKMYWANGTQVPGDPMGLGSYAVPTGNWSLLSSLVEDAGYPGYEEINTATHWGYKMRSSFFLPEVQLRMELKYAKSTGFLSVFDIDFHNQTSDTTIGNFRLEFAGEGIVGLIMDNILYVGIGVAALVIIGLVVCKRK